VPLASVSNGLAPSEGYEMLRKVLSLKQTGVLAYPGKYILYSMKTKAEATSF
jgi:hypothetical protein